ncbi:DNA-directed RNA polymerase subunit A' [Candidatus Woesearchaeota archaeon]|nr:DNA-directed RNA polymerase subunit A' [Candidatus Woesearchaeota archaeon]
MKDIIYKKIERITFGSLSPKEIKKMSAAKIVTPELYDKEGYPVDGGLMDVRLGVIDPGLRCKTCGLKLKECIGHFGYIELARPILHIKYIKVIHDALKCTCKECGVLLLDQKQREKYQTNMEKILRRPSLLRKRGKAVILTARTTKKCPHCGAKQSTIKIEKPTTFLEDDRRLSPIEIRSRLEKLDDDTVTLLGMNPEYARPEWFTLTLLPIPPVTMRPSITLETGERSEDDLTHKLGDIVRINQRLFENISAGAPEVIVEDLWDLLQYHVTTYFDNEVTQVPPARHRSGQPLKTLTERIKSKEGRFRYNLTGKRVNFAARTVISPDSQIHFNEVGVPKLIALELTVPERVTGWNKERLKAFVERGPKKYPGSNYVIRPDGKKKKITDETREQLLEEMQPGYIVERHLMDGDLAIFNRQPSLHKMSIMCHRIRVMPGRSFRLNPAVCFPYNADFDGDEMNLHIPQTEEAMAEAEVLMQVQTQIISPKHGLNVIGCIEDAIAGNYILTAGLTVPKDKAVQLLVSSGVDNRQAFRKFGSFVSGKDVFSALLPDDFSLVSKCRDGTRLVIKLGAIKEGVVDSNSIGEEGATMIRSLHKKYGPDFTIDLMGKIFRLGINVLFDCGFTTGVSDTDLPEELMVKIRKLIQDTEKEVQEYIEIYNSRKLEIVPGKTAEETLELHVLQILNKVRNKIGDLIANSADEKNPTIVMARSGSRGNILNLSMIAACVGQQALRGKRIDKGYKKRTLSLFKKGELSPKARGFIGVGFKDGLDPVDFFFGSMTGRDSLMDTALRTPKSGYLYRRLANALQDIRVEYDHTVRGASGNIVQFHYGDDDLDVAKTEKGTIDVRRIVEEVKIDR